MFSILILTYKWSFCDVESLNGSFNHRLPRQGVFNTVILPMLSSVRLHHLFITASSATELNPTRWRKKEPHAILVEIAKVVLRQFR